MMQQQNQQEEGEQIPQILNHPNNPYGSSIVEMTDTDKQLYEIELTLRGYVLKDDGTIYSTGQALCNHEGVLRLVSQLRAWVSRLTIMSNVDEKEISKLIQYYNDTLILTLMMNRVNWEIGRRAYLDQYNRTRMRYDSTVRDDIVKMSMGLLYPCLKRAMNGDDKKFWKGSVFENLHKVENNNKGRSGFLNFFNKS
jgi:hypothetical protein